MARIKIFTGHFGSGKTEIAINYAMKLANEGKKTAIVDLDIVNPYFCTRNVKKELEDLGIRVISSSPELVNAELMVVPSEVSAVFNDKSYEVIIDVGGDEDGAVVLGRYNKFFKEEPYEMYFVFNNKRPLTSDISNTKKYVNEIEKASRLKVTNLISNANLSYETSKEDILKGDKEAMILSKELQIPYTYIVCKKNLIESIKGKVQAKIFPIDIYMKTPWNK